MSAFRRLVCGCVVALAACGGAEGTTPVGEGHRLVSGRGFALDVPDAYVERRAGDGYELWLERPDGAGLLVVSRVQPGEVESLDQWVELVLASYEAEGARCEVLEAPSTPANARTVRCRGVHVTAPADDARPLDTLVVRAVEGDAGAFVFACYERASSCRALLESARVDASIAEAGRIPEAALQASYLDIPAFPLSGGLAGEDATRLRVPAHDAPARGATRPLVTIVEFTDLECPFCARVEPTIARLREAYPEDVRVVLRHNPLPFHPNAFPAAVVVEEARAQAGDSGFFRMLDAIFREPRGWGRAELLALARGLGFDAAAMDAAIEDGRHDARIRADAALAQRVGASGTPNFFINGRQLTGAQPYEAFAAVVDEEIALARRALEAGVPRARLYEAVQASAYGTAVEVAADAPPERRPLPPDPMLVYRVPVDGQPSQGPGDALVTIVVFTDFQCPFCARVEPTLTALRERYGADLRVVYRQHPLPFHEHASLAAEAALEAFAQGGDAMYARFHALLFENQRALARTDLEAYAAQLGLDRLRFARALDAHTHAATVDADAALARSLGANGTPTFFINGHVVRGAQPLPRFVEVVERELTEARALVDAGTSRASLYAAIIRDGLTSPPPPRYEDGVDDGEAMAPEQPRFYAPVFTAPAPTRGAADAPIVLQLFTDFECPFCARIGPTLERILEVYAGRVRLELHNYPLPFHANAHFAAQIGREVFLQRGSEGFFRFYDAIFAAQRSLDRARILQIARALPGIDARRLERAANAETHRAFVDAEIEAVHRAGMSIGTPSLLIDGQLVQGAIPFEDFQAVIDARLAARSAAP